MTLREIGSGILHYWEQYSYRVTSYSIIDWYLSDVLISAIMFIILVSVGGHLAGLSAEALYSMFQRRKTPKILLFLDQKLGYLYSGLVVVVGVIAGMILIISVTVMASR